MTITKESSIDKIEIVGEYKHIQVRTRTDIIENDEVISSSFERYMVMPTQDTSDLPKEIQDIAKIVHTKKVKDAYIEDSKTRQEG
jgi:hypothetical protein